ncbi:MAG: Fumarate hydratase class I, aerobic [Firmicutes bacterium ADurb.Bin193]|nr:MAG: Fumarate hydratase class I, aerobic [Firmicutes bacterium ADurb.Bin193]
MIKISTPLTKDIVKMLTAGDRVLISGYLYTARDAAHRRITEALARGEELPFDIKDQIIYYAGPAPAKPGDVIGSCGPTTSGRVDIYTPRLIELGLSGMLGKGERSDAVVQAMKAHTAVYFAAVGGAGALIAQCVTAAEPVAYADLGAEAIVRLTVRDLPAVVVIDSNGGNAYVDGKAEYRKI